MISNSITNGINGYANIPGDKSISQRALIISLVSSGKTIIQDILDSEDVYHTMKAIEQLGAKLKIYKKEMLMSLWAYNITINK